MPKFHYKPSGFDESAEKYLRAQIDKVVRRLKQDYELYLKPIVLLLSKEGREEAKEREKMAGIAGIVGDAMEYYTVPETATILGIMKKDVLDLVAQGEFEGVVYDKNSRPLIPKSEVQKYFMNQKVEGKTDEELLEIFEKRLKILLQKYDEMQKGFRKVTERAMKQILKKSQRNFERNFRDQIGVDLMKIINKEGLKEQLSIAITNCTNLITSIPQKYFDQIQKGVFGSVFGNGWSYEGGLQKYIYDLGHSTRERAALIARDQSGKAMSSFNQARLENCGFDYYIWRCQDDIRTAGNPNGDDKELAKKKLKYRKAGNLFVYEGNAGTDTSKAHGNHWDREGKLFSWKTPPPDGHPGMGIQCRCYAEPWFGSESELREKDDD